MITYTNKENLSLVVRSAYSTALILTLASAPLALAQDTNAPTTLKPIVVTGSYIPTAETVGPAPVQTITAVEIEKVGAQDVLELVKKVSTVFGGNVNVGQTVNNGGFGEANVAIRNLPTLVMLNSRRLGKSAFSNGALVDVNTIPLAMIDRIEILKDGASALYGSSALGGVGCDGGGDIRVHRVAVSGCAGRTRRGDGADAGAACQPTLHQTLLEASEKTLLSD